MYNILCGDFMNINLNLLKYFYVVVNEGNITKAAEKLFVTQPAITRSIKELEDQFNSKLLERSQKGVVPTQEGLILFNHLKNVFREIDTAQNIIESNNNRNDLYIGTTTGNFFNIVTKCLSKFNNVYPDVTVHIFFDSIDILEELKSSKKLDILIKNDNEIFNDFSKIDDFELNNVFIAKKGSFNYLDGRQINLKDLLNNYPLVLMSNISPGRRNFDNYLKSLNIDYKPTYEFNSYDLCKKIVDAGIGIGIDNPIDYVNNPDYVIIDTEKLPTRIFNFGYVKSSKNPFIKEFIKIYKSMI